jgi:proteasome accessory factor A
LAALIQWSHDPTLSAKARTGSGQRLTALELQFFFLEEATRFVDRGGCAGIVPDCREILRLWKDTLVRLQQKDWNALARRLDWVLKLLVLRRAMERDPGLNWQSPELKHLDQMYGSLDPADGLYWAYERAGLVERIVPDERIEWFMDNPPENTRAWTRAMLLRRAGEDCVDDVDWDRVRIRSHDGRYRTVHLTDPLGHTKASSAGILRDDVALDDVVDAFEISQEDLQPHPSRRTEP